MRQTLVGISDGMANQNAPNPGGDKAALTTEECTGLWWGKHWQAMRECTEPWWG
ncbi:hypothetical protein KDAU_62170 [Dictyobacter aurantiacus]|uniref:Uncharacterized protein n=1 Tax=Dictyobacter aurantiacus TaxID=1936993 RepID=A0A401ZPQ5_9CHLR|nr:hypothetical protein KDAU_62170 [Dictyobacter aurantiacus]